MNEKVAQALSYVDHKYVAEAAKRKKRRHRVLVAVAAVLALVMFFNVPTLPLVITARAVSTAAEPRKMDRPNINSPKFDVWWDEREAREEKANTAKPPVFDFAELASREVLSGVDGTNRVWSPINAYIALAMTAELTGGETQQEVLDVLGVSDTESLRQGISALWETIYNDNGREISVLANSLWLDREVSYRQEVMDILAYHYYASVYQGDLGSGRTNKDIANWLNNQTGGFLKDRSGTVNLNPESMLAMASTIYFQAQWSDEFDSGKNTQELFHAVTGDVECTFMNAELREMNYYWAKDYGAVQLFLKNGSMMWFILPDEDKTVDDVLSGGDYMDMVTQNGEFPAENHKWMKVNLSVPQFDISASTDLKPGLEAMGLTKIFEPLGNDFSPSIDSEIPVYLDSINQDTRVAIDEEGVTAASYILLEFGAGAAPPPDEIIDFVLDRPFVFAICSDQIPLFVGTVNMP